MAVRKTKAGLALKRWFKEDWKDQRTGTLWRQKGGGTPYCDHKRISRNSKTGLRCQLRKKKTYSSKEKIRSTSR